MQKSTFWNDFWFATRKIPKCESESEIVFFLRNDKFLFLLSLLLLITYEL